MSQHDVTEPTDPGLPELDLPAHFALPEFSLWHEAAEAALKGADFERRLYTRTLEGLRYAPLYTADSAELSNHRPPAHPDQGDGRRKPHPGWEIVQEYAYPEPERLAAALRQDREQGLEAAALNLDALSPAALSAALQVSMETHLPLYLRSAQTEGFERLRQAHGPVSGAGSDVPVTLGYDPLGAWVQGHNAHPEALFAHLAGLFQEAPGLPVLEISALPYHEAGAHAAQELAYALGSLVDSLEALRRTGLSVHEVLPQTRLVLGSGVHFFMELAKFRAARMLVQRVAEIYAEAGQEPLAQPQIQARTSRLWLSRYDPYVNFLRQTVGALAAVLGGADAVTTGYFNERSGVPDDFARRLARNMQLIFKEEVHLDRLLDPAGGSYFLESLSTELAQAAWKEFQELESQGGLRAALQAGSVQTAVAQTAQERLQQVARRQQVLVGLNQYANPTETLTEPHCEPPLAESRPASSALLPALSLAEGFESLRIRQEASPVSVLLLSLGQSHDWRARADFSRAFFQLAGCSVLQTPALAADEASVQTVLAQVQESGAQILVFCSTDALYPDWVRQWAPRLKQSLAPDVRLALAGNPREERDAYVDAGVDEFIYLGCDALSCLEALLPQ